MTDSNEPWVASNSNTGISSVWSDEEIGARIREYHNWAIGTVILGYLLLTVMSISGEENSLSRSVSPGTPRTQWDTLVHAGMWGIATAFYAKARGRSAFLGLLGCFVCIGTLAVWGSPKYCIRCRSKQGFRSTTCDVCSAPLSLFLTPAGFRWRWVSAVAISFAVAAIVGAVWWSRLSHVVRIRRLQEEQRAQAVAAVRSELSGADGRRLGEIVGVMIKMPDVLSPEEEEEFKVLTKRAGGGTSLYVKQLRTFAVDKVLSFRLYYWEDALSGITRRQNALSERTTSLLKDLVSANTLTEAQAKMFRDSIARIARGETVDFGVGPTLIDEEGAKERIALARAHKDRVAELFDAVLGK